MLIGFVVGLLLGVAIGFEVVAISFEVCWRCGNWAVVLPEACQKCRDGEEHHV